MRESDKAVGRRDAVTQESGNAVDHSAPVQDGTNKPPTQVESLGRPSLEEALDDPAGKQFAHPAKSGREPEGSALGGGDAAAALSAHEVAQLREFFEILDRWDQAERSN